MADAIDKGLERGDVKVNSDNNYELPMLGRVGHSVVDRWRKVRDIPPKERQTYYKITDTPNRSGLLKWHGQRIDLGRGGA